MRILLIYPGIIFGDQPLGLLYISAALKKQGHETKLFEPTPFNDVFTLVKRQLGFDVKTRAVKAFLKEVENWF